MAKITESNITEEISSIQALSGFASNLEYLAIGLDPEDDSDVRFVGITSTKKDATFLGTIASKRGLHLDLRYTQDEDPMEHGQWMLFAQHYAKFAVFVEDDETPHALTSDLEAALEMARRDEADGYTSRITRVFESSQDEWMLWCQKRLEQATNLFGRLG